MHLRASTTVIFTAGLLAFGCSGGDPKLSDGGEGYISIQSIEPVRGPQAGGNTVVVTGSGFASPGAELNNFLVGDQLVLDVDVVSDSEIRIVMPPFAEAATVDVTVFNGNGTFALSGIYSYNPLPTISSIEPERGPTEGGQAITITGQGFAELEPGENTVFIGGVEATVVEVRNDGEMVIESPSGVPPKAHAVSLQNANGSGTLPEAYTYVATDGVLIYTHRSLDGIAPGGEVRFLDLDTQVIETAIPPEVENINGIAVTAVDAAGIVYKDTTQRLFRLNVSGERTELGFLEGCQNNRLQALAFHQGTLFAFCRDNQVGGDPPNSDFGTVDLSTMTFTPVGSVDVCCRMNLASDGTSLFFMRDNTVGKIDATTGVLTEEVTTPLNRARGMLIHNGRLLVINRTFAGGGGGSQPAFLYDVDPVTGQATLVMDLGPNIHGISAVP